jgi:hypothetical protein
VADPARRHRIGIAARAAVVSMTWDAVARDTLAVYEQVCRRRARRRSLIGGGASEVED